MVDVHDVVKDVFKPFQRVNAFLLTHGEERIDHGSTFSGLMRSGKQVIFLPRAIGRMVFSAKLQQL